MHTSPLCGYSASASLAFFLSGVFVPSDRSRVDSVNCSILFVASAHLCCFRFLLFNYCIKSCIVAMLAFCFAKRNADHDRS